MISVLYKSEWDKGCRDPDICHWSSKTLIPNSRIQILFIEFHHILHPCDNLREIYWQHCMANYPWNETQSQCRTALCKIWRKASKVSLEAAFRVFYELLAAIWHVSNPSSSTSYFIIPSWFAWCNFISPEVVGSSKRSEQNQVIYISFKLMGFGRGGVFWKTVSQI